MTERISQTQMRVYRSGTLGRKAPAGNPAFEKGRSTDGGWPLPLGFQTRIDPASVLIHVRVPGEPVPWQRDGQTQAKISETTGQLVQPHRFTSTRTRQAETDWRWIMLAARTLREPVPHPVGVLAFFRTRYGKGDSDNLVKLVLDSANGTIFADDQQVSEHHVHVLRRCTDPGTDLLIWMTDRRIPGA